VKTVTDDKKKHFLMEDKDVTVTIESILSIPNLSIITIRGTVNRDTSLKVDEKVMQVIEKEESDVILNLSNIDYLSSVGMMSIVKYLVHCTDKKRLFKLVKPPKSVYETMIVFGIAKRFDMYDNIEAAISTLQ
jgi:anti-anti-sigma factor